jgi:hypothetical protein
MNPAPIGVWTWGHKEYNFEQRPELKQMHEQYQPPPPLTEGQAAAKVHQSYQPFNLNLDAIRRLCLPDQITRWLEAGVPVDCTHASSSCHPGYDLDEEEARVVSEEMERGLRAGHLRRVAPGEHIVDVHPMILVRQGSKNRACQDYSTGLNRKTPSSPFTLPRPFDLRKHVEEGSWLAKMDLRDGFWCVPISKEGQKHFGVRNPTTKEVMVAQSLPFGWARSPQFFCAVTTALAERLSAGFEDQPFELTGSAGTGSGQARIIKSKTCTVIAYFDDFVIAADTESECQQTLTIFEEVCKECGFQYAPHKKEGPSQIITFLGVLVSTVPGASGFALPPDKVGKYKEILHAFRCSHASVNSATPREIAKVIGVLSFTAQVTQGGTVFMRRLYHWFGGTVVDWKRGHRSIREAP